MELFQQDFRQNTFSNLFLQFSPSQLFVPIGILIVPMQVSDLIDHKFKKCSVSKLVPTFTIPINCSCDLKHFANSRRSYLNLPNIFFVTRTFFFSHRRSEQFWKQNAIISKIETRKGGLISEVIFNLIPFLKKMLEYYYFSFQVEKMRNRNLAHF